MTTLKVWRCEETVPVAKGCECTNAVHQHPMTGGYSQEHAQAQYRFDAGWINRPCPECEHYGWLPRRSFTEDELKAHDTEVAATVRAKLAAVAALHEPDAKGWCPECSTSPCKTRSLILDGATS